MKQKKKKKYSNYLIQSNITGTYKKVKNPPQIGQIVNTGEILCYVGETPFLAKNKLEIIRTFCKNGEKITPGTRLFMAIILKNINQSKNEPCQNCIEYFSMINEEYCDVCTTNQQ